MKNLINRSANDYYHTTTHRGYYNKLRKEKLESQGEIYCTICPYNGGENRKTNRYLGICNVEKIQHAKIKHPSWKLATKNRKQWMEKPKSYKMVEMSSNPWDTRYWIEIKF
jgi:septin family protein